MNLRDELTTGPLSAELAPLIAEGNDDAILAVLNRRDIPAKGKVSAHDIQQYLMVHDLILLAIESNQTLACIATKRALEIFPTFELSKPEILEKFEQILTGLEQDTLIPDFTAQHKADLLAMGDVLISRTDQIGFVPTLEQIRSEIWNDDGSRKL